MLTPENSLSITYVGDCGVDEFVDQKIKLPGGIALNGAVHARLNFPPKDKVTVITALGDDGNSEVVKQTLEKFGINYNIVSVHGDTPVQLISNTSSGEKKFLQYKAGVIEGFELNVSQQNQVAKSDLTMTVLFGQVEKLFDSVITAKEGNEGLLTVDFMDLSDWKKGIAFVEKYLPNIDIGFFGLSKTRDGKVIGMIKHLARKMNKILVVTLGVDGSIAFVGNKSYIQPAFPVEKVVDTTGAGDAFAAVFLKTFIYSHNIPLALQEGTKYAAKIIGKVGTF